MTQLFPRQTLYAASFTLTGTGDALNFRPARPVIVTDWGFIITTSCTGTSGVAKGNLRPTAGSTSGQTVGASSSASGPVGQTIFADTAGGTMTIAATQAAGTEVVHRVKPEPLPGNLTQFGTLANNNLPGSGLTSSTASQGLQINPGQEFAINVTTGMGTAGAGIPYVSYFEMPLAGDFNAPGSTNAIANVTFLDS